MSMMTYPLREVGAFLVDELVAAYVLQKDYEKTGEHFSETVKEALENGTFYQMAENNAFSLETNDFDCFDPTEAFEVLNDVIDDINHMSEFVGSATTLVPERAKRPLDISYSNDCIAYIPASRMPELFSAAYESLDELIDEFKEKIGAYLPDNFDWAGHICTIDGTYFC